MVKRTSSMNTAHCLPLSSYSKQRKKHRYLEESRLWAKRLSARQTSDEHIQHFWTANQDGSRPYFHAAEAGLPVIALCEYLSIEDDSERASSIKQTINNACEFEVSITNKVKNPFGYPRQYVKVWMKPNVTRSSWRTTTSPVIGGKVRMPAWVHWQPWRI